jgi:hypothetical protein
MTVANLTKFVVLIALLFTSSSFAHAQNEVCGVTTYFVDLDAKASSSRFLVGKFDLQLDEDNDDVTKFFHHEESGVDVAVGVWVFGRSSKGGPKTIRVVLSFTGKPDDNLDSLEGTEAESIYDKRWRWLSVSNNIKVRNRIYTFTFGCERKNKKRAGK